MIRNFVAAGVLVAVMLAGWSVWRQLDRPVRTVRVEGALSAAEQAAIREAVSGTLDAGLLSLDTTDVSARIRALSWPRTVEMRRVWPDGLIIRVDRETVVAAWGDGGYLTSAGEVVRLADGVPGVPALATELSSPRRAMEVYQMLESRVGDAGLSIARLQENGLGEWQMTFQEGMRVALGNEALGERLERFLLAYRKVLNHNAAEIAHVDARYDNGVAVRWHDASPPSVGQESEVEYALR